MIIRMKKKRIQRKKLMVFFSCLFGLLSVCAQKVTIGGMKYYLYPDTHEAVIDLENTWSGELDIPSEISHDDEVYTIKGITYAAFKNCIELTKVRIPKTIDDVVHHAFSDDYGEKDGMSGSAVSSDCMNPFVGCTALESIEVDEDNPIMKADGGILFSKDGTRLYCYPAGIKAEKYVVPEGVTWIGNDAFGSNEYIVSVELPASVVELCSAFGGCKRLEKVNLPKDITYLKAYLFKDCASLKSIQIPSGVKWLGEQVFYGCSSLRVIDLPESVQSIGNLSFWDCQLDVLVIRGTLNSQSVSRDLFSGLNESAKVYVPFSEIERYRDLFVGSILPLEDYHATVNIQLISSPTESSHSFFDLSGRHYQWGLKKGIVIQNGKKKLVK